MSSKFEDVPVDEDTRIVFESEAMFDKLEVLYQKWIWDGIAAESLIFLSEDLVDIDLQQLETEIKASTLVQPTSQITVKEIDKGYTFFNFNFQTD